MFFSSQILVHFQLTTLLYSSNHLANQRKTYRAQEWKMRITFLITLTDKNPKQIHAQSPQMQSPQM